VSGMKAIRFCTKLQDKCRYGTHQDNKAAVLYIQCPRANTARLHPSLSLICLEVPDEDDFEALETGLQPINVWVTYINAINEHDALNNAGAAAAKRARVVTRLEAEGESKDSESPPLSTWTKVYAPPLDTLTRDAASMKTPGCPNRRAISRPVGNDMNTEDDIWQLDDIKVLVPDPLELTSNAWSELLPKWGELTAQNWNKLRKN
jgi:hypothetical protein